MGKKTKSKQRLDQYYRYAKTQGYRSRAAYKLIQLNRKYNFLSNATTVIDLCAAPGGWMQVCANTMPPNSTIIGVDLDEIKKVQGASSFKGDITKQETFERLRKQLKGRKCDAVLNDGAPNVGANWNKDAYTQSQLVLAAFKLASDFLREGGYFVTKIFRSTDTNSLMWMLKKFFEKVQMTKPKASRFASAETFVVGIGYNSPKFIDQRYFDPKYVFKDTEADHFHQQIAGQITSIDKLLQNRRKRGGYQDNAPMHMYKQTSLTNFINSATPLLVFAQFNKITVSQQERSKYYGIWKKIPDDVDDLLNDLKVLGKAEVGSLLRWRGKIREFEHREKQKLKKQGKLQQEDDQGDEQMIDQDEEQVEEGDQQQDQGDQYNQEEQQQQNEQQQDQKDSQQQIQRQILNKQKKQLRNFRDKQNKQSQLLIKAQAANEQLNNEDMQFGQEHLGSILGSQDDIEQFGFENNVSQEQQQKLPKYINMTNQELEDNLQQMYELKQKRREQKIQHAREIRRQKKQRKEQRAANSQRKLKSRRFGNEDQQEENKQIQQENNKQEFEEFKFKNPLAAMADEDIYLSEEQNKDYDQNQKIDPNEKMQGQLSDDDAYVIPKPETQMQKRRKRMKKNQQRKERKLHKSIEQGQQVGGQIEIVKHKKMEDYNIDSLAQTLVIAKKMLRNHSREDIIDASYHGFDFQDHDSLPKWFSDDEKKHNFKSMPITKQQFQQEKQRLMAINARVPKKILEAKVRRKIRIQKKLKKTQKKAQNLMSQEGINQVNKLRQVGKLYDKSKRQLKDTKKYVVGKKGKTVGGKDSRKVKHVDKRMKKDKVSKSKPIKKTRHVKRHHKRRGKF